MRGKKFNFPPEGSRSDFVGKRAVLNVSFSIFYNRMAGGGGDDLGGVADPFSADLVV